MPSSELVLWCALAIGMAFGVIGQITGLCLNRGLRDYWVSHHPNKLRAFLLAMAVAIIGTQGAATLGIIDLESAIYLVPTVSWLLLPAGAVMFGYGMILANGCGSRALVLLGQGNARSLVVLVFMGISAYVTLTGLFAPLRIEISTATSMTNGSLSTLSLAARAACTTAIVLALLCFALWRVELLKKKSDLLSGLSVGLLIIAGWLTTGWIGADEFEPTPVASLTFVAPVGEAIQYAMIATGMQFRFGAAIVVGVIFGSILTALFRRKFHIHGFHSPEQTFRSIVGGVLMGVGGALASGCSVGQGLTGMSTLAYESMLATVGIFLGGWLALRTHKSAGHSEAS